MNGSGANAKALIGKLEMGAALLLTAAACYLHVLFPSGSDGLLGDEVVSFNVAAHPSLTQVHEAVRFDCFPSFFHLLLRAWLGLGWGESDLGTRALGLSIGLAVLGALWLNDRVFASR